MSNSAKFRIAYVGYILYSVLTGVIGYQLDDGALDAAWAALPENTSYELIDTAMEEYFIISAVAIIVIISACLASIVGVYFFKNWARWLTVGGIILLLPTSLLIGPTINSGFGTLLYDLGNIGFGALVAAMFFPPISKEFNKSKHSEL